jgi:hypothetical protein
MPNIKNKIQILEKENEKLKLEVNSVRVMLWSVSIFIWAVVHQTGGEIDLTPETMKLAHENPGNLIYTAHPNGGATVVAAVNQNNNNTLQ